MKILTVILYAIPIAGMAQPTDSFDTKSKLRFHAKSIYSPWSIAGSAASAGILHGMDSPEEWGQGVDAYSKRAASVVGRSAIRATLAFGLDSTLRQDPRYFRSSSRGFWRRTAHALRGTVLTRTDAGRETLSVWRIGSAYGTAFISNQWYPDRPNAVGRVARQGSLRLVFDFGKNLASEFAPDLKRKLLRQNP